MDLYFFQPKIETEDLLGSITKNCETLIKQTHRKAEKTLEHKLNKPTESFQFIPPISIEGLRMLGLTSFEVYNSVFKITEEDNKFELYTDDPDDEFSFIELKDRVAEVQGLSDISPEELKHGLHGSDTIETYRKLSIGKSQTDEYSIILIDFFSFTISRSRKLS